MPPPALTKTWSHTSIEIPADVDEKTNCKKAVFAFKNYLVTTVGWTVDRSCDALSDPVSGDSWTDWTKLRWGRAGSVNFYSSWIVLTHPVSGGYLYFRCVQNFSNSNDGDGWWQGHLVWSPVNPFTGGGRYGNNNPSAVGERVLISNTDFLRRNSNQKRIWHCMMSSDQKSVRLIQLSLTSVYTSLLFEMPDSPHSTFTNGVVVHASPDLNHLTYARLHRTQSLRITNSLGQGLLGCFSCGGLQGVGLGEVWNLPDIDSEVPMLPLRAWADSEVNRYWVGNIPDMWLGPTSYASNGDTYSDALGNPRQFVQFNHLILPWDGSVPVIG